MKYTIIAALFFAAACGSSDKSTTTGPAAVASVQLSATSSTLTIGQTTTLTATALDASGNSITGESVTWSTSSAAIATVNGGLVTAVAAGTATITATIGAKSSQAIVTVTSPVATSCTGVTPLALAVGEVHVLTAAERSTRCAWRAAPGASEYVLVPFKADTFATNVTVSFAATGTTQAFGAPTAAAAASASLNVMPSRASGHAFSSAVHGAFGAAFEHQLRVNERNILTPLATSGSRLAMQRSMLRAPGVKSAILGLAATPRPSARSSS